MCLAAWSGYRGNNERFEGPLEKLFGGNKDLWGKRDIWGSNRHVNQER